MTQKIRVQPTLVQDWTGLDSTTLDLSTLARLTGTTLALDGHWLKSELSLFFFFRTNPVLTAYAV